MILAITIITSLLLVGVLVFRVLTSEWRFNYYCKHKKDIFCGTIIFLNITLTAILMFIAFYYSITSAPNTGSVYVIFMTHMIPLIPLVLVLSVNAFVLIKFKVF